MNATRYINTLLDYLPIRSIYKFKFNMLSKSSIELDKTRTGIQWYYNGRKYYNTNIKLIGRIGVVLRLDKSDYGIPLTQYNRRISKISNIANKSEEI